MSTQYPNAIDSYPVHSDNVNEKIAASVLNNIQDAIVALEQKLGQSGLTSMPTVGPADSLTIVNHQVYISNGTSWNPVGGGSAGSDAIEVELTSTSATTVASYTPKANGNYVVYVYFRVTGASTNVTVSVTYDDAGGPVTNTLLPTQSEGVGSWSLVPLFINVTTAAPIVVSVTAGIANQVYASASVVGV
ncbi:hypothetical protein [Alicyclobacillus dauci]|uniref:Carbohydrate binding domain-containing protein n=1 Tax=Alicyclobacillus dauci TaxID=1475485 RepID=A0ABY6YX46_9BACL|nr:hypothetical protein [Alicyclobacillus dauci]WAH35056.1 hypothetical protein NZD86_12030 [Alicyclobacillus dauci]